MNDTEIIKAIAELDGWTDIHLSCGTTLLGTPPNWSDSGMRYHLVLFYLTSRDAIVPVIEKCISSYGLELDFYTTLQRLIEPPRRSGAYSIEFYCIKATPRQLCEALLRATGKWNGDEKAK